MKFSTSTMLCLSLTLAPYFVFAMSKAPKNSPKETKEAIESDDFLSTADINNGKTISFACGACHSLDKGELPKGLTKVGPKLFGIVDSKIARQKNYEYSEALNKMKDKSWSPDELYLWLKDPIEYAPGTKMSFGGLPDPQDRIDLIAYLKTLK